ncbi:hypothetical protein SAMN05518856_104194 [Paenibacillus sp. OK003]|nr:hypothetical protein SAMN05518856_104194 [Paenibacillus sp. OK003]
MQKRKSSTTNGKLQIKNKPEIKKTGKRLSGLAGVSFYPDWIVVMYSCEISKRGTMRPIRFLLRLDILEVSCLLMSVPHCIRLRLNRIEFEAHRSLDLASLFTFMLDSLAKDMKSLF